MRDAVRRAWRRLLQAKAWKRLRANVGELRGAAIEPLPQSDRMPRGLRELKWAVEPSRPLDAARLVRTLRGRHGSHLRNDLGCAYAILAWRQSNDEYWLRAIAELEAAEAQGTPEAKERAKENLERVVAESPFAVGA